MLTNQRSGTCTNCTTDGSTNSSALGIFTDYGAQNATQNSTTAGTNQRT